MAFDSLEDLGIFISIIDVSECTSDSLEHRYVGNDATS